MKLFTAIGPGNIVGANRFRLAGKAIPETSFAFSEQLFAYCKFCKIETLAISQHSQRDQTRDGIILLENRPKPSWGKRGSLYHMAEIYYALYLAIRARRFGADIALIDSGTTHYFALTLFRVLGIRVAVNLHNVLWPAGFEPTGKLKRIIRSLNSFFFKHIASGAMGVSPECERQVLSEAHNRIPFVQYRCQFSLSGFEQSKPYKGGPFRIIYASRVEQNKGALDIPSMSAKLKTLSKTPVIFDICGDGAAIGALRRKVEADGLRDNIVVNGRLERSNLLAVYANAHAVIVPTRSDFAEGMPQVCAEAMLCDLPVITSKVANAFDVLGPAIVPAKTNDIDSYVDAILSLINEQPLYAKVRSACAVQSIQFTDRSQSYPAAVDRLISILFPPKGTLQHYDGLFQFVLQSNAASVGLEELGRTRHTDLWVGFTESAVDGFAHKIKSQSFRPNVFSQRASQ